jgi:acetylornithine/succinyldiaminopimelate/putrescine aminotransferase
MSPHSHNLTPVTTASQQPLVHEGLLAAGLVGAVLTHQEISAAMTGGYDGSTFGGNPMAMTAALIATRQMKNLGLPAPAHARGQQIDIALQQLGSPHVKGRRVLVLMVGIDLAGADEVAAVQSGMMEQGVHSSLSTGATLRWMPPLVITVDQVDHVMHAFASALETLSGRNRKERP